MKVERPKPGIFQADTVNGRLRFDADNRRGLDMWLLTLDGKRVDVMVCEHEDTRSVQSNAYYWRCVVGPCVALNGDTPDDFHDEMCLRFLTRREIEFVDYQTGEAVQVVVPGRSSKLKIHDFYLFVENVRKFAAEFLGVVTEDPDPLYWQKRGRREDVPLLARVG